MSTLVSSSNGTTASPPAGGTLPEDPVAFVAEAQRISNEADAGALTGLFAPDVVFHNTVDGAFERYRGDDATVRAWRALLPTMKSRGMVIQKQLLATTGDMIVNNWEGTIGSRPTRGIEAWRFDADGKVCEHHMYTTLSARPSTDPRGRLRFAANYPVTAARMLLEQRRAGARPARD